MLHFKLNKKGAFQRVPLCNGAFVIIYLQANPDYYGGNETSWNIQTDKEQSYLHKWLSNNLEWSGNSSCMYLCGVGTGSKPSSLWSPEDARQFRKPVTAQI